MAERTPRLVLGLLALTLLGACDRGPTLEPTPTVEPTSPPAGIAVVTTSTGDEVEVVVEVADAPEERRVGLMHRPSLPADHGMVFLWDEPTDGSFWMKDTLIPLSIAFWDERGRILAILDMEPCEADPCPVYDPGVAFAGAIEVNQGFFEEHGIRVGDRVELT